MSGNAPENTDAARASPNMVVWKCPKCLRIPPGEIYQCLRGHSFCHACIVGEKTCPNCDAKMCSSKNGFYGVRNILAEFLLNKIKFECRWKDQGCKTLKSRETISKHENACIYGPVNLCNRFSGSMNCTFQTYLYKSLNVDEILKHIKTAHGKFLYHTEVGFGSLCFFYMDQEFRQTLESRTKSYIFPMFVQVVHFTDQNLTEPSRELFVIFLKVEVGLQRDVSLSWLFVWLTSEAKENNFSVKMTAKIFGGLDGEDADCVPDMVWTLNPIRASEFAEWKLSQNQKLDFPFSLPLSHINKHYLGFEDLFTMSFTFSKA